MRKKPARESRRVSYTARMSTQALASHFQTMARYNQIVNLRLYEACLALGDAEFRKQRFASFGSIHRTLNHIMVGDRISMSRFEGRASGITALDEIFYHELAALWRARQAEDEGILSFAHRLDNDFLKGTIRYTNNLGESYEDPASLAIAHMFNHQTHHRAQVQAMLGDLEKPPNLDLHRAILPRAGGAGA